ncbi:UDP-2,4-diacetamido-2,4,6-trideoxy-beta-L-altropyranose hydrolase [Sphingomonas sp. CJ20]
MIVAIRADSSRAIGTGHLHRMLALATALRSLGAEVRFLCRDLVGNASALVERRGFVLHRLPEPEGDRPASGDSATWAEVSQARDARECIAALADCPPDWAVVDHYALDAEWHARVRAAWGCRIAAADDLGDRPLVADLLLDQNLHPDHRAKYATVAMPGVRLLAGPRFALLGADYAHAPRYRFRDTVGSIGVFLGGVDLRDDSARALAAIDAAGFSGPVEVVSTSANPHLPALRARVDARPATRLSLDLPSLHDFFARHDLHIGAGGGATWERCCIGAPTLALVVADNQRIGLQMLEAAGAVAAHDVSDSHGGATGLAEALAALLAQPERRRALHETSLSLVDGRGAQRVALAMLGSRMTVRPAAASDSALLLRWRNDPATRRVSHDPRAIGEAEHAAWLDHVLGDPARLLLIGSVAGMPVGVIRFDPTQEAGRTISLYLDPGLHGLGLGRWLLAAGERHCAAPPFHAAVLENNAASARLFERAGYVRTRPGHFVKSATRASLP